jgi:hypothetical protein
VRINTVYFRKTSFFDRDDAIYEHKGTDSQFVGYEVVIVWNETDGIENSN